MKHTLIIGLAFIGLATGSLKAESWEEFIRQQTLDDIARETRRAREQAFWDASAASTDASIARREAQEAADELQEKLDEIAEQQEKILRNQQDND
jgi:hypothetical protein